MYGKIVQLHLHFNSPDFRVQETKLLLPLAHFAAGGNNHKMLPN